MSFEVRRSKWSLPQCSLYRSSRLLNRICCSLARHTAKFLKNLRLRRPSLRPCPKSTFTLRVGCYGNSMFTAVPRAAILDIRQKSNSHVETNILCLFEKRKVITLVSNWFTSSFRNSYIAMVFCISGFDENSDENCRRIATVPPLDGYFCCIPMMQFNLETRSL